MKYQDDSGQILSDKLMASNDLGVLQQVSAFLERWQSDIEEVSNENVKYMLETILNDGFKSVNKEIE